MAFSFIEEKLNEQTSLSRYRKRRCITDQNGPLIQVDGKQYLNFSSNDYLGLQQNAIIENAFKEGVEKFGSGASASSLVTGHHYAHQALEETLCEWVNKPRCLLFSSGFSANVGVLNALGENDTHFYLDKLSHASLIDGTLSSNAKFKRFAHNNVKQLEQYLTKQSCDNKLIVSEGVFSMDGDQACINKLVTTAKKHNAWTYIDDAHSLGVIGKYGEGSSSYSNEIDIVMGTFGKAIATSGAFIGCSEALHEYFINFSRHYIYSTAISPAVAWATRASVLFIQQANAEREKIKSLSKLFSTTLDPRVKLLSSDSSIHAIVIGSETETLKVSEKLKNKGIWLSAIRPPTVAPNSSRLRVTICSNHNVNDIKLLANSINEALF